MSYCPTLPTSYQTQSAPAILSHWHKEPKSWPGITRAHFARSLWKTIRGNPQGLFRPRLIWIPNPHWFPECTQPSAKQSSAFPAWECHGASSQRESPREKTHQRLILSHWRQKPNSWPAITRAAFDCSLSVSMRSLARPQQRGSPGGPGTTQKVRLGRFGFCRKEDHHG